MTEGESSAEAPAKSPSPPRPPGRARLAILALTTAVAVVVGGRLYERWSASDAEDPASTTLAPGRRVVSLSPGVTDTVVALGRSATLVGISDYCRFDEPSPRRVGTALTPNYEGIAIVEPTVILTSDVRGEQLVPLENLAPTKSLPWLTVSDWAASTRELGVILDAQAAAERLATQVETELSRAAPEGALRVLLALDYGQSGDQHVWFIKRNSIHGALLEAAGAKNAIDRNVVGPPKMSPEQLLAVDPDAIVMLLSDGQDRAASLDHLRKWQPLRAIKNGRIDALVAPDALTVGPRVLELIEPLKRIVARLAAKGTPETETRP